MKTHRLWILPAAALALALAPASSRAALITYTAPGAEADFTTSNGQLSVTLTNTLSAGSFTSSGQAISDISFTLSNAPGSPGTLTASGQFGDISGTGLLTYKTSDTQTGNLTPVRWFANGNITGSTITLEAIGGGQPSQMIAPFLANGGTYTSANQGVQNFNSYVIGPGTFTLGLSGVTANTTITAVTFSYGTGPDTSLPGTIPNVGVPEPATIIMALGGLSSFGVAGLRKMRRKSAA